MEEKHSRVRKSRRRVRLVEGSAAAPVRFGAAALVRFGVEWTHVRLPKQFPTGSSMIIDSKRKRVLIDPKVQWALARRLCYHWFAFFGALIGVSVTLQGLLGISTFGLGESLQRAFMDQVPYMAVMVVILPLFLYDTMKLSNRFVGPMYRVRKSLEQLAEGEQTGPVKFRQGDFWQEVSTQLNGVRERLEQLELENRRLTGENRKLRRKAAETDTKSVESQASVRA